MTQTSLNRFRVIAQVGKGGMSDVYLAAAQGVADFQKLTVLKVLRSELAGDSQFLRMFRDEARLAARLNHPNVVQTYEVGEFEGRSYIAMEYLEGQPLSQVTARLVERDQLSTPLILRILIDALEGLHYAHELKDYDGKPLRIVHRDATPQNIFLTYQGQVKVVDFGIAKAVTSSTETKVGTVKGKISYMAPEQARGDDLDRRADLFTIGVVLWELLSGRRLWEGLSDVAIMGRLVRGEVPELSPLKPGLPSALLRLCKSALHPDPNSRPQTALELQLELEHQLADLTGSMPSRRLGEILNDAFTVEQQRVSAVIARQLERLREEPITGVHTGLPHATEVDSVILPKLNALATSLEQMGTSLLPSESDRGSARSGTAVISPTGGGGMPAQADRKRVVQLWAPVTALLAVGCAVGASGYYLLAHTSAASGAREPDLLLTPPPPPPAAPPPAPSGCDAVAKPLVELSGDISEDATLRCDRDYLLRYTTSIASGATLTIQAGTVIKGDRDTKGTLVVQPGGRIDASGTKERPIVLTSSAPIGQRQPGDWGGVVILGRAPTNHHDSSGRSVQARIEGLTKGGQYGGQDAEDNSGTLRYVRIEYSGDEIAPNNEINGLSLGGVGRGTVLDHILVRNTADDCFEFFGGTVDAKYLVCQDPGDDAFDWDFGYTGRLQFLVAQASAHERSGSNGFEGDNDPGGSQAEPVSRPQIYNATLCGKNRRFAGEHYGILVRRGTKAVIKNTIFSGFLAGLDVRDRSTRAEVNNSIFFANLEGNFARPEVPGATDRELHDDDGALDEHELLTSRGTNNLDIDPGLRRCFDHTSPEFAPGRAVEGLGLHPPDDGFFTASANYPGALRDADDQWLSGAWARWTD